MFSDPGRERQYPHIRCEYDSGACTHDQTSGPMPGLYGDSLNSPRITGTENRGTTRRVRHPISQQENLITDSAVYKWKSRLFQHQVVLQSRSFIRGNSPHDRNSYEYNPLCRPCCRTVPTSIYRYLGATCRPVVWRRVEKRVGEVQ